MPTGKLKDKDATLLESLMRDSPFDDTVSFSRYNPGEEGRKGKEMRKEERGKRKEKERRSG
jgi:hypothetical protein